MRRLGFLSILIVSHLSAQPLSTGWVQGKLGEVRQQGISCIKDNPGFGVGVGTWLTPRWGVEADWISTSLNGKYNGAKTQEQHVNASGLWNPWPESKVWIPYLRVGMGFTHVGAPYSVSDASTTRFSYHGGLGVQRALGPQSLASLELRAVNVETRLRRTEYQALAGIGWRWGVKAASAAAPAPAPLPPVPSVQPAEPIKAPEPMPVAAAPVPAPLPPPTPEPVKAPEPPPAKIILDEALLHFANSQAELPADAVEAIRTVAKSLKAYSGAYTLMVTGHTSSLGGRAYNKALSLRRADAVAKVLIAEGIPADRVKTDGLGPDKPLTENKTRAGQAKNRRVEIDVKAEGVEVKRTETGVFDPNQAAPKKAAAPKPAAKATVKPSAGQPAKH